MLLGTDRVRRDRARASLFGLSVGDALGEQFFGAPDQVAVRIAERTVPRPVWSWTDDTQMAAALVEHLEATRGDVRPDRLMATFAQRFEIRRGYGSAMRDTLAQVRAGSPWRPLVHSAFGGRGSWGNGAAMRVAPLGAWWSDDVDRAAVLAAEQAVVTHTHPEAAAGAVAVAVAAALLATRVEAGDRAALLTEVASYVEPSLVRDGLVAAAELDLDADSPAASRQAAQALGNGDDVSTQRTVPFALWCALSHPDDLVETFWTTVAGLGDRDTTSAIACGVVAARVGVAGIPSAWLAATEPLPR